MKTTFFAVAIFVTALCALESSPADAEPSSEPMQNAAVDPNGTDTNSQQTRGSGAQSPADKITEEAKRTQEQIEKLEKYLDENPNVFDWRVHNELRDLYCHTNIRKSLEQSDIILKHSCMDGYILNILSGWQIDKDAEIARVNLLENVETYPDLRFMGAASLIKIGDLYSAEGNKEMARKYFKQVADDKSSDMKKYCLLAKERLNKINDRKSK